MADAILKRGSTSNILRVTLRHATTGQGLPSLTFESAGLIISTITNNEAAATAYDVTGGLVETISTLGTYAAPTATKCRFKEVDATNHPGLYELHLADARFAVASAKRLMIAVAGAANLLAREYVVELVAYDPQDTVRLGLTTLPNAAADAAGGLVISEAGGLDADATAAAAVLAAVILDMAVILNTTIATLASQTSFTLTAGSGDNDFCNGCVAVIKDSSTATQRAIAMISDYVGATKTVTLFRDPGIFTMATGDHIAILAPR